MRELDWVTEKRGYPYKTVNDHGTELTSNAIQKCQEDREIEWHYIAPRPPMQHSILESFNGPIRIGCLKGHPFDSMCQAYTLVAARRIDFNHNC